MLRSPAAVLLVLLMAVGSVVMWIGVPLGLIYLAAHVSGSSSPSVGPYLLILLGLPIGMAVVGKLLGWLDRLHSRLTGRVDDRRRPPAWMRSLRAERSPTRRAGVLDRVMLVSVVAAVVCFVVWFFGFAGSSLPN